jgi:hypothetical protein
MCKHSTDTVDRLAKRQRGLDARGNDPMATRRESSWAAGFIQDPPGNVLATTLDYLNGIPEQIGKKQITGATEFKQKLGGLGPKPTGLEFADFFANQDSRFKGMMDEVGNPLQNKFPELDAKAREQPFFKNRGRNKSPLPRERRLSMDSRHVGITTGADRTGDTKNVYSEDRYHAKGAFLARLDDETVKKFQKSGAPFIAGASGTLQFIALEMENRKPFDQIDQAELQEREKVLTMMSVQHVAAGHHSMSECLLAAKVYGYFDDVPDPLVDYDAAMKAFEKHMQGLGLGSDQPLSRASENEDKGGKQVKYEDRLAFVKTFRERYVDQIPPDELAKIDERMTRAADEADRGKYGDAIATLAKTENMIRGQASLIAANARGNNRVLRPDELAARMGGKSKVGRSSSKEYKEVKDALAVYEKSMKELAGRKLDHDRVALGFESLRAQLATVEKAADAYKTKHGANPDKADRRGTMDELIARLTEEMALLEKAERESGTYDKRGDVTIEQAIEYARFDVRVGKQVQPDVLKESRITNKQVLGAGGISTVMLIDYKADDENDAQQFAFKPEKEKMTTHGNLMADLGIDPNKPGFGKRNIASRKMAEAAGLGDLIPDAKFTTVDGKVGLAMQKAEGEAPVKRVKVAVQNPEQNQDLQEAAFAKQAGKSDWKSKIPEKSRHGMRYEYDDTTGNFMVEKLQASSLPLESPPAKPEDVAAVQQQLVNMQWLDALCGQVDRHAENYLVDTSTGTPTIMGIDNDFSFGKNRKDPTERASNSLGFPPIIDQATFDKMKAMDWDDIAESLGPELSQDEIDAAKDRFDAVQNKLGDLEQTGMVVQSFDKPVKGQSVTAILMDRKNPPTYYQRDVEYQQFLRQG